MPELISLRVDGRPIRTPAGTLLAAALIDAGCHTFARSVEGAPRGPVCGMGVCFECRVFVEGRGPVRACRVEATAGMEVRTDG